MPLDLSQASVSSKWPATHPDWIQLFTEHTLNGAKVSITLEELGLPYEVHHVSLEAQDQKTQEFLNLSPNNKIPAIIDPNGPDGVATPVFESGAILFYLAEKTGKLMPDDPIGRLETMQWLMFQMASVGPMFGQFGHFHKVMAGKLSDPYPVEKYATEARRLYGVIDQRLFDRDWIVGDSLSIVDIAVAPWIWCMEEIYLGSDQIEAKSYKNLRRWYENITQLESWQKGLYVGK